MSASNTTDSLSGASSGTLSSTGADTDSGDTGALDVGLVAYYPFNGDALDHSGNGNDCTIQGATAMLVSDRFGHANSAYSFEGTAYMDCGDGPSIAIAGDLTLSAWFNADSSSLSGGNQNLVAREVTNNAWYGLEIQNQNQAATSGYCGPTHSPGFGISTIWTCAPNAIGAGTWHHAVGVFRASQQVAVYVDGKFAAATSTSIQAAKMGTGHLIIGANLESTNVTFRGVLDDVRVYGRALSESEIASLYDGSSPDAGVIGDSGLYGAIADSASE